MVVSNIIPEIFYSHEMGLVRTCLVNFRCRDVLLIWIIVGQGPIALAVGAGGDCLDIFSWAVFEEDIEVLS